MNTRSMTWHGECMYVWQEVSHMKSYDEERYSVSIDVLIIWADGQQHADSIKGFNAGHALSRAWLNWEDAESITIV